MTTISKTEPAAAPKPLFSKTALRAALAVSERKFDHLRAAGIIPDPLDLGPRAPRWTDDDYQEILRRLPRRPLKSEPANLAEGRQARIAAIRAATVEA